MALILVVEDEEPIANILKFSLEKEGYTVAVAFDGIDAIEQARFREPSLVLLDLMLPEKDGFEVCREIRTFSTVPIIMLTARENAIDKVLGLEIGADDYVTKPFNTRELLARIKANLRRISLEEEQRVSGHKGAIHIGSLSINLDSYEVTKRGEYVTLTSREFELLTYMAGRPGQVFTRDQLLMDVWGSRYGGDDRTIDVTIRRLREKIEDDPSNPTIVMTKRGVGYFVRR